MRSLLKIVALLLALEINAQLPDTDLWLFKIGMDKKTKTLSFTDALNITNRPGYDNQPSFSSTGKLIYFSSIRSDSQADIYIYDTGKKRITQLTKTRESEYSPVPLVGNKLSSVVVEADSAQRIHLLDAASGKDLNRYETDSVGYYTFLNSDTVVYYKLTDPHSLRFFSHSTGEDRWLGNLPVRGFKPVNRHTLLYGLKDSLKTGVYLYDFLLHKARKVAETPAMNEDLVWHEKLGILSSDGSRLLVWKPGEDSWETLFDFSASGITRIARFAFDPKNKRLVVVSVK